jgi:hypothetical protein
VLERWPLALFKRLMMAGCEACVWCCVIENCIPLGGCYSGSLFLYIANDTPPIFFVDPLQHSHA